MQEANRLASTIQNGDAGTSGVEKDVHSECSRTSQSNSTFDHSSGTTVGVHSDSNERGRGWCSRGGWEERDKGRRRREDEHRGGRSKHGHRNSAKERREGRGEGRHRENGHQEGGGGRGGKQGEKSDIAVHAESGRRGIRDAHAKEKGRTKREEDRLQRKDVRRKDSNWERRKEYCGGDGARRAFSSSRHRFMYDVRSSRQSNQGKGCCMDACSNQGEVVLPLHFLYSFAKCVCRL